MQYQNLSPKFNPQEKMEISVMNRIEVHVDEADAQVTCDVCYATFANKNALPMHMMIHKGEKPYECSTCNKRFTQLSTLQGHVRTHTGDKPFACSYCKKTFGNSGTRNRHEKTHFPKSKTEHACGMCDKTFSRKDALKSHQDLKHIQEMVIHCDICYEQFVDSQLLLQHMSVMHPGETTIIDTYTSMLEASSEATRTAEESFHCHLCPKSFSQLGKLTCHMMTHNIEKTIKCDDCGKMFTRKSHLKRHMLIHLEIEKHVCKVCFKAFRFGFDLKRHMYTHDGYPAHLHCQFCSKGFSKLVYLNKHLAKVHGTDANVKLEKQDTEV